MRLTAFTKPAICLALAALTLSQAHAHRAWILPSSTVLSGDAPYVTFDAAISNTLFHPDHVAMGIDGVEILSPLGNPVKPEHAAKGKYRSTFDIQLAEQGTYKIAYAAGGLRAFWEDDDGNRKMWPGRGQTAKDSEFDTAVPKGAKNLRVSRSYRRIETFVTLGAPSDKVFTPTNQGLELIPQTHPNDLYATETARFRLLFNGEPANGAEVEVIPGGMRYRDSQQAIKVKASEQGYISITWPVAGQYFLEAGYQDDKAKAPATQRRGSYSATFEVLPL